MYYFSLEQKTYEDFIYAPPPQKKKSLGVFFSLNSGGRQHKSGKGQIRWVSGSETQNQPGLMEVQVKIYFNCSIVILGGSLNKMSSLLKWNTKLFHICMETVRCHLTF